MKRELLEITMSKDIIESLKKKHGMTLPEIAKVAGITKAFISKIERGDARFTVKHIGKMEDKISVFVSLGEYLKEKLIAEYKEKGKKVPKDILDLHEGLMKCLRAGDKLRKVLKKKE